MFIFIYEFLLFAFFFRLFICCFLSFDLIADRPVSANINSSAKSIEKTKKCTDCLLSSLPRQPTSASSKTNDNSSSCCTCFGRSKLSWSDSMSGQMSDIYSRKYDEKIDSPACLNHLPDKLINQNENLRSSIDEEIELTALKQAMKIYGIQQPSKSLNLEKSSPGMSASAIKSSKNSNNSIECELANDVAAVVLNNHGELIESDSIQIINCSANDQMIRVQGKEELPVSPKDEIKCVACDENCKNTENTFEKCEKVNQKDNENEQESINLQQIKRIPKKINCTDNHPLLNDSKKNISHDGKPLKRNDLNGNRRIQRIYATLPKIKKPFNQQQNINHNERLTKRVPMRLTPDGTTIHYWCDLSPKVLKGCRRFRFYYF